MKSQQPSGMPQRSPTDSHSPFLALGPSPAGAWPQEAQQAGTKRQFLFCQNLVQDQSCNWGRWDQRDGFLGFCICDAVCMVEKLGKVCLNWNVVSDLSGLPRL